MTWKSCASRGEEQFDSGDGRHPPIAHAGRIIWLWRHARASAIYDPASDRWSALADPFNSTNHVRSGAAIVSTGDELLVWGGALTWHYAWKSVGVASDGARLGAGDTWKPMASEGAPAARGGPMHVWTGRELVVWGGLRKSGKPLGGGGAYSPATDTWRKLATAKAPAPATNHRNCVWTGREMWMWSYRVGHAFDPSANTWRDLAPVPGPTETSAHGQAFLALGDGAFLVRQSGDDDDCCSAWRYEARRDRWKECARPPAIKHAAPTLVACGDRIVVGLDKQIFEYSTAHDTWSELPSPKLDDAPHLVWIADRLFACSRRTGAMKSLRLR